MQHGGIGEGGAVAFARALEKNSSLTALDLAVCEGGLGERRGNARRYCTLLLTCIQHNTIGNGGAVVLARVLELNNSIAALKLGVRGMRGILLFDTYLHAVEHNRRRRSGGVSEGSGAQQLYHCIASRSMRMGGRDMKGRRCVILTDIKDNAIGEGGAVALARALELNNSITTLDLQVCGERRKGR